MANEIQVYKQEEVDGIAEQIRASACLAYQTEIWDSSLTQAAVKEVMKSTASEDDLFYLNTILVTTGWNKNRDVFPKLETWKARYTPVDKQFNLEHDQSKIIGHMISAKAVSET